MTTSEEYDVFFDVVVKRVKEKKRKGKLEERRIILLLFSGGSGSSTLTDGWWWWINIFYLPMPIEALLELIQTEDSYFFLDGGAVGVAPAVICISKIHPLFIVFG